MRQTVKLWVWRASSDSGRKRNPSLGRLWSISIFSRLAIPYKRVHLMMFNKLCAILCKSSCCRQEQVDVKLVKMDVWEGLGLGFCIKVKTSRENLRECFPSFTEVACYGISVVPFPCFLLQLELLFMSQHMFNIMVHCKETFKQLPTGVSMQPGWHHPNWVWTCWLLLELLPVNPHSLIVDLD